MGIEMSRIKEMGIRCLTGNGNDSTGMGGNGYNDSRFRTPLHGASVSRGVPAYSSAWCWYFFAYPGVVARLNLHQNIGA